MKCYLYSLQFLLSGTGSFPQTLQLPNHPLPSKIDSPFARRCIPTSGHILPSKTEFHRLKVRKLNYHNYFNSTKALVHNSLK